MAQCLARGRARWGLGPSGLVFRGRRVIFLHTVDGGFRPGSVSGAGSTVGARYWLSGERSAVLSVTRWGPAFLVGHFCFGSELPPLERSSLPLLVNT